MTDYTNEELQHFFGPQRRSHVWGSNDIDWAKAMMNQYQNYAQSKQPPSSNIPRILHFIWLGPRPMPNVELLESWRVHHSDWEIQVWRNDNVSIDLHNNEAFVYALDHELYGMASDILRCEVLYKYGGVYVDVDYVCVGSLQEFDSLKFYCGASHTGCIEVNNGILACAPQSPILKIVMEDIHTWFEEMKRPLLLVSSFMGGNAAAAAGMLSSQDICRQTGPGLWTRILGNLFCSSQEIPHNVVVFPYSVFHPMPNTDRHLRLSFQDELIERYAVPNTTKAIHLWHCTWQQQGNTASNNDEAVH